MSERVCNRGWRGQQSNNRRRIAGAVGVAWTLLAGVAAAQTQQITRVSVDGGGGEANGASMHASASADGRFVAFESAATNLVPSDTNGTNDVFVKDRQTGAITRISVKSDGTQAHGDSVTPSISADGRFVAFASTAALVADDTNDPHCFPDGPVDESATCADIYVHDRITSTTTRVSVASNNTQANGASYEPRISGNGRYVVFRSAATNLAGVDANGTLTDIFVRDLLTSTTSLVSVTSSGVQGNGMSFSASISDDGAVIAFVAGAALDAGADPGHCGIANACGSSLFVRTMSTGTTRRIDLVSPVVRPNPRLPTVSQATLAPDGRTLAATLATHWGDEPESVNFSRVARDLVLHTIATAHTQLIDSIDTFVTYDSSHFGGMALSGTGRVLVYCSQVAISPSNPISFMTNFRLLDTTAGLARSSLTDSTFPEPDCDGTAVSGDGNLLFFSASAQPARPVGGDTNNVVDVFALDRDPDHDGMPSDWETTFGLDPTNNADAATDPDGDGKTNLQEFQAGTHPKSAFTRYLAEGAQNQFFSTFVHLYNSGDTAAVIEVHYLGDSGAVATSTFTLDAKGMTTLTPLPPDASFSTVVESDRSVAVERTMTWAGGGLGVGYGSSAETAIANPAPVWYFAEGTTGGPFSLFYLLQNPTATDARVTITYLLPGGQAPIVRTYVLAANSRRTIPVDDEPGLAATDVSATIESDQPIFAERSIYLSRPDQPVRGRHLGRWHSRTGDEVVHRGGRDRRLLRSVHPDR